MNTWKPVRGFPPYEVSNEGEVRNSETGKLSTLYENKNGCESYNLKNNNTWRGVSKTKLMIQNYPYEWIKYLEEGEEVKPLKGYPGYYITSYGRVWSMKKYKFLSIKKEGRKNSYYYRVGISHNNIIYNYTIHTLVGRNFLPEYREGLCILHKEETLSYPEINYVENLWVGSMGDNIRDRDMKGRSRGRYSKTRVSNMV